jgi:hypothetical protein
MVQRSIINDHEVIARAAHLDERKAVHRPQDTDIRAGCKAIERVTPPRIELG